ncbi:alpha/beta hydrolase [archaeon]|nr:MAG: alpha/beta hydrolase [archaeon]
MRILGVLLVAIVAYMVSLEKQTMDFPTYVVCKILRAMLPITFPKDVADAQFWRSKVGRYIRKSQFFKFHGRTVNLDLAAEDGSPLPARIYIPTTATTSKRPTIVWIHGGGFVVGNINVDGGVAAQLAAEADMVGVIITYRLAPEHIYPAAVTDCRHVLEWIKANIHMYGGDGDQIYIAGESAGGNLAAVMASINLDPAKTSEDNRLRIQGLVLVAPSVAPFATYPSVNLYGKTGLLTTYQMEAFRNTYVNHNNSLKHEYTFAPINTPREVLAQYPPTVLILSQYDPLLDEGVHFSRILQSLGVFVTTKLYETSTHGFFGLEFLPYGRASVSYAAEQLRSMVARG